MSKAIIWTAVSSQAQLAEDKISLAEQESDARKWCQENGYEVIELLSVPGYSRRESDIITALEDFARQKIFAYHKLREHWSRKDFDLLVAYHHSRFGRSSTLHSWVIENTILSGARIYLIQGGMIDAAAFRFQIAMGGASSASEVDRLVAGRKKGIGANLRRGLPASYAPGFFHRIERDPVNGKAIRMVLDESKARIRQDLATLILEGVGWYTMEYTLYQRFGHINPNLGRAYASRTMYQIVYNPLTWGHTGRYYHGLGAGQSWVYDDDVPPPEGVELYRHTIPAAYEGQLAEDIKAELRRRQEIIRGRASPKNAHPFTGLLMCAYCERHYVVSTRRNKKGTNWRCTSSLSKIAQDGCAAKRKTVNQKTLVAWFSDVLEEYRTKGDLSALNLEVPPPNNERAALEKEIADVVAELDELITNQKRARTERVTQMYADQIAQAEDRLEILEARLKGLGEAAESGTVAQARQHSLAYYAKVGATAFWDLPANQINQHLHSILGRQRLLIADGQVVGIKPEPKKRQTRFKRQS